jgi:hypothetical protein
MQLVFDPTITTTNSKDGRFEDNTRSNNNTSSKVWWQLVFNSAPQTPPTSAGFNPRSTSDNSIQLLGAHDGNLLLSPTATSQPSQFFGTMVGVFFVALNLPTSNLTLTPFVLVGRSPGGLQKWTSPFVVPQTSIVQSVFGPPTTYSLASATSSPYTPGSTGFYLPLSQVANKPTISSQVHHYPFLVGLVATIGTTVVAQWCHDPEMDVSM